MRGYRYWIYYRGFSCRDWHNVHGYIEEGTITTAFDMRVKNKIDRFNLVIDAVNNLYLGNIGEKIISDMNKKLEEHNNYIKEYGEDLEEIRNWRF